MSAAELLVELVPDDNARAILTQLTGIKLDGSETAAYVPPPQSAPAPAVADSWQEENNATTESWNDTSAKEDDDDLSW